VEELFRGNYRPLYTLCKKYEAFQDMPFLQDITYAIVDSMFPGSKFILTVRESNAWFESMKKFHLKGILNKAGVEDLEDFDELTFKDKAIYLKKNYLQNIFERNAASVVDHKVLFDWSLVYNKVRRIELYERRNQEIVKHFQERRDQLLVLELSKEHDTSKVVEFLNLSKELVAPFTHLTYIPQVAFGF